MVETKRRAREVKPRQYPSENKRPTVSFRVRADTFEKLKDSAKEHDLSLSEEVERCVNFKFEFARDAHDELVMRSVKTALDMGEKIAGARWFENQAAARLVHAAIVNAANLLIIGLGAGEQDNVNAASDATGSAIASVAVNQTAGFGMTEARRRYEEAVASYKHFDRERYIITKTLSEEGLPLELATRPVTSEELAAFQAGAEAPTPKRRGRAKAEA